MKGLSIEQKAQRYDEAIERAKNTIEVNKTIPDIVECVESLFPELAELEDEKTIKELLQIAKESEDSFYMVMTPNKRERIIAWLEKQERKHADSYCQENCKGFQETGKCFADGECKAKREAEQKTAWSEEDKQMLQNILECLRHGWRKLPTDILKYENWLKSLRPKSQWKPSEEQLKSLKEVIDVGHFTSYPNALEILYEQLKKLREE
jgi:hypothetical protein